MNRIRLDSSQPRIAARWAAPLSPAELLLQCPTDGPGELIGPGGQILQQFRGPRDALIWLDKDLRQPAAARAAAAPFRWVGYLSYDLGRLFEDLPATTPDPLRLPLLRLTRHRLAAEAVEPLPPDGPAAQPAAEGLTSNFTSDGYQAAVRRVIDYIAAGDIFQVNLSQRFQARLHISPAEVYARLQDRYPAWYAALLQYDDFALICNSPELFIEVQPQHDGQRRILTRPIKGTRPRSPHADGMERELRDSLKDQAELNMIVDLERNDLGRICQIGSVRVSQGRTIERHPTVYHGAASVEGILRQDVDLPALLRAVFPGGSITGAPKIRAMQIIEELEPCRRGPYCGAIGYFESTGRVELNVAIRTMIVQDGRVYMPVGGGIVADSDPRHEYEETLVKARAALAVLDLDEQAAKLP